MKNTYYQICKIVLIMIVTFHNSHLIAQDNYLQGYQAAISGNNFSYHSPLPDVGTCLLTRASSEYEPIEWETEIVPQNYKGNKVSFIWLFGIDVTAESQDFDFFINGEKYFTFSNPIDNTNDTRNYINNGAELIFNRTMIDKHKDQMGFAILELPITFNKVRGTS